MTISFNSSKIADTFQQRFSDKFRDLSLLPAPLPFRNTMPKIYPSQSKFAVYFLELYNNLSNF